MGRLLKRLAWYWAVGQVLRSGSRIGIPRFCRLDKQASASFELKVAENRISLNPFNEGAWPPTLRGVGQSRGVGHNITQGRLLSCTACFCQPGLRIVPITWAQSAGFSESPEHPAIGYSVPRALDPIVELNRQIRDGDVSLKFEGAAVT